MAVLPSCGGGLGLGALGAIPLGDGSSLAVLSAVATARNAVDVTFTGFPAAVDPATLSDALHVPNWTLDVREPFGATERLVQHVESTADPSVVRVFADGRFTPDATYRITVNDRVEDITGVPIDPNCTTADFVAFPEFRPPVVGPVREDERTDLANPQQPVDAENKDPPPLGTFQINDRGDFALERGRPYLRKRILRRATSALGSFFHLPAYGFAEPIKGLITPDLLRRIQTRAQSQILREPDVVRATVSVSNSPPNLVILRMRVVDREGNIETVTLPVEVSG